MVVLCDLPLIHHVGMNDVWIEEAIRKVNRRIGEIRAKKGITQAKLAEKLDLELRVFQRFEAYQNLTLRNLFLLTAALDCRISEFFYEAKKNWNGRGRPRKKKKT
jgi:transcriptional regulator with XRE-family HTH domain